MPKLDEKKFLFLLLFVHLVIALPFAYYLNIWVDEASTLHSTGSGFAYALDAAFRDENQSPLYFLLLSLWRTIDPSIFFTRIFSIICSLLAIWVSFGVAKRFLPEYAQKFALVIFALHPFLFWASTESRGYSLSILLTALLLRYLHDAYLEENPTIATQFVYITLCIVALYTNYFLGFFLVANFCALLALRKLRPAAFYLGHMAIVGVFFLPLFMLLAQQVGVRHEMGDSSLFDGIRNSWQHLQTLILPANLFSDDKTLPAIARLWLFRLGAAALLIFAIAKKFKNISANTVALGTITFVISIFFIAVVAFMGAGYANIRHAAILLLPLTLFFTSLIYDVLAKKGLMAWGVLLIFFFPFAFYQLFSPMAKRGDWEKAAAYIQANEKPGQIILPFDGYDSLGFRVYYKGPNSVLPVEGFFPWSQHNNFRTPDTRPAQARALTLDISAATTELWVLTGETCNEPETSEACRPLEDYLNSNYTIIDEKDFYLEKVRLYRRK